MTKEEKQLVLQDICSRLLYGLHVRIYNHWTDSFEDEILSVDNIGEILHNFPIEDIKPYLRPMSSMTEEEEAFVYNGHIEFWIKEDYCNKHHLDYRGLILMGLALEVPEEMYKAE